MEFTSTWVRLRLAVKGAGRNARTALSAAFTLVAVVAATGPQDNLALYGRYVAGADVGPDVGRLLFLGMGFIQIAAIAALVGALSLAARLSAIAVQAILALRRPVTSVEVAHV